MQKILLEICAGSVASALAAEQGGADRVELCTALRDGGLTPSYAAIKEAVCCLSIPVRVLIRPRAGDFLYTPAELREMCEDIRMALDLGVEGVVCGALDAQGNVDLPVVEQLLRAAGGAFTFHRAFDMCRDPFEALAQLQQLDVDTILTSGQAATAAAGVSMLKELSLRASQEGGKLSIMAGCGLNPQNIAQVASGADVRAVHLSARKAIQSGMLYRKEGVVMGSANTASEYNYDQTDVAVVRACREALDELKVKS